MNEIRWERLGAASGFAVVALGAAGAAFERGAPDASATGEEFVAFFADNRGALLMQSLLFVLSAGAFLWFLGSLRDFLAKAEGGTGRLSMVAFGAGAVGIAISVLIQAPQIALAVASRTEVEPGLAGVIAGLGYALTLIAYVPLAVMFAAVAVIAFRTRVFPVWLGWLSAVAAAGYLMMSLGIVVDNGPLVPGAELTYIVLPIYVVWLIAVTAVMIARLREPATAATVGGER
ncbi:MAG TPA: hypothetical protein VFZ37_19625 [Jiangellaceae bacterium]